MGISQKDIATELDLSVATVCRSLQGHPGIRPKTRKKVIELASKLGYRPWETLRRNNSRDTSSSEQLATVGVAIYWPKEAKRDPTAASYYMLAGISEMIQNTNISQANYFVTPERCEQIVESQYRFPEMQNGKLSGLVLIYNFPRDVVRHLSSEVPCVSIVHSHLNLGVDCIDNDHAEGINVLVNHLHGLGHRRIGFISGLKRWSWIFPRFAGYMQALNQLGLPRDTDIEINVAGPSLDAETQADVVAEHVRNGVTAWVCADDYIAYDLYPLLIARGLRVPQDVSLVGFSGLVPPRDNYPKLTSVHPPFEQMGVAAGRRLLNRIKRPNEPVRHVQFGCEFVEGETTAPPPGRNRENIQKSTSIAKETMPMENLSSK